jgi:hypothetical protein
MKTNNLIIKLILLFTFITSAWASVSATPSKIDVGGTVALKDTDSAYSNSDFGCRIEIDTGGNNYGLTKEGTTNTSKEICYSGYTGVNDTGRRNYRIQRYYKPTGQIGDWMYGTFDVTPPVPSKPNASDGLYEDKTIISWSSVSGVEYYKVYRDNSEIRTNVNSTSVSIGEYPGVVYAYSVSACTSNNICSSKSTSDNGYRKLPTPPAPNAADGTEGYSIFIDWNQISGATKYKIYRDNLYVKTVSPATQTNTRDVAPTQGKIYNYSLQVCNDTMCGDIGPSDGGYIVNQVPTIEIRDISMSSEGDVRVYYAISDPEEKLMGTDMYITTTSDAGISGISKKSLLNKNGGTYTITFPRSELSNLNSGSSYQIIADVFDDKGLNSRKTQIFTYNYTVVDNIPTLQINTTGSSDTNPKNTNFIISTSSTDDIGLNTLAYSVLTSSGVKFHHVAPFQKLYLETHLVKS